MKYQQAALELDKGLSHTQVQTQKTWHLDWVHSSRGAGATMGKHMHWPHNQGTQHRSDITGPELCAGCRKSGGAEGSARAKVEWVDSAQALADWAMGQGLVTHRTMGNPLWSRMCLCRSRSSPQTGDTILCRHLRSRHNLPQTCSTHL